MKKFLSNMTKKSIVIIAIIIIFSIGIFFGVSTKYKLDLKNSNEALVETKNKTIDDAKEDLKTNAVETNFNKIFNKQWESKEVFTQGIVCNLNDIAIRDKSNSLTFCIKAKEGNDYFIYSTVNMSDTIDIKNGDIVKIYGFVDGRDSIDLCRISVWIVEKL